MAQIHVGESLDTTRFPSRWAWFPVGLLGLLVSVQIVLFKLSSGDDSFAIEPEYYQKAVNWDERAREVRASERLGWQARATMSAGPNSTLLTTLRDSSGVAVSGASVFVEAFPNARATRVQHLRLQESSPGVYESAVAITYGGVWELRVVARTASQTFTKTLRITPTTSSK